MKLLLVEDDNLVADALVLALQSSGYAIDRVDDGFFALSSASTNAYDLIILDLGLPDIDGLECLRRMRKRSINVPILILTARDSPALRIEGLDSGASDYVTKPFHLGELEARIRALFRLAHNNDVTVEAGELSWSTKTGVLRRGEQRERALQPKSTAVLEVLLPESPQNALDQAANVALLANYDAPASHNGVQQYHVDRLEKTT